MPTVENPGTVSERLRNLARLTRNRFGDHPDADLCDEAADLIEALEATTEPTPEPIKATKKAAS